MNSESREKLALIVFCILIVLGLGALCSYIFAGHSWNVAASNIDDSFGSMEGYTCILYEGTNTALESSNGSSSNALSKLEQPVSIYDVKQNYLEKDAAVLLLHTADLKNYEDGMVLSRGGHRFGIVSFDADDNINMMLAAVKKLEAHNPDTIIAFVPQAEDLKGVEGIDLAICTDDAELLPTGEYRDSVFCVAAPRQNSVGAILISPSNVVSAKTFDEM